MNKYPQRKLKALLIRNATCTINGLNDRLTIKITRCSLFADNYHSNNMLEMEREKTFTYLWRSQVARCAKNKFIRSNVYLEGVGSSFLSTLSVRAVLLVDHSVNISLASPLNGRAYARSPSYNILNERHLGCFSWSERNSSTSNQESDTMREKRRRISISCDAEHNFDGKFMTQWNKRHKSDSIVLTNFIAIHEQKNFKSNKFHKFSLFFFIFCFWSFHPSHMLSLSYKCWESFHL